MKPKQWFYRLAVLTLAVAWALTPQAASAQADNAAEEDRAPEILSAELGLSTPLETDRLTVNFVIVDSNTITEVTINGEAQSFTPDDTVMLTKSFVFTEDQTVIEVTAKDESGNSRTVRYTAYLPGVEIPDAVEMVYFVSGNLRYEIDSNPSTDLSLPISLPDVPELGVVPDSQQADTRITLGVIGGLTYGPWSAYLGFNSLSYSKAANDVYGSQVNYLGGGWRSAPPKKNAFRISYTLTDINLGGGSYAVTHTLTPGYEFNSGDNKGSSKHVFGLDYTSKDFASGSQKDGSGYRLKWDYTSLDAEAQDSFRSVLAYGTDTEGLLSATLADESAYTFLGYDADWRNRWDSGVRFNIGFGMQFRSYANDVTILTNQLLGDTRVDSPLRFSYGVGYDFAKKWSAMFNYRYVVNISNDLPYVRSVYGLQVQGAY